MTGPQHGKGINEGRLVPSKLRIPVALVHYLYHSEFIISPFIPTTLTTTASMTHSNNTHDARGIPFPIDEVFASHVNASGGRCSDGHTVAGDSVPLNGSYSEARHIPPSYAASSFGHPHNTSPYLGHYGNHVSPHSGHGASTPSSLFPSSTPSAYDYEHYASSQHKVQQSNYAPLLGCAAPSAVESHPRAMSENHGATTALPLLQVEIPEFVPPTSAEVADARRTNKSSKKRTRSVASSPYKREREKKDPTIPLGFQHTLRNVTLANYKSNRPQASPDYTKQTYELNEGPNRPLAHMSSSK